jgi:hypothetical protein
MVFIELQLYSHKLVQHSLFKINIHVLLRSRTVLIRPDHRKEGSYELPVCVRETGGEVDPNEPIGVATRLPRRPMAVLLVSYDVTPSECS